jgi:site-specific DNA-methyltransferase (adenine-specific)
MERSVFHGDCREVLKGLPENSVESCVTDPPYELTSARPGGRSPATEGKVMKGFMGMKWDGTGVAYDVTMWKEVLRVLKPGAHLLAFGGTRTYHRLTCAIEDAGFEIRDQMQWLYGSGFPKSHNLHDEWEGWGTALKPANEPICLARKPLSEDTVAANVLRWGVGALNIDACRVPGGEGGSRDGEESADRSYEAEGSTNFAAKPGPRGGDAKGRWPANVVHDGSQDVLSAFPDAPGQCGKARTDGAMRGNTVFGEMRQKTKHPEPRTDDSKSAARFFYCAKASRSERDDGLEDFEGKKRDPVRKEGNPGGDNPYNRGVNIVKNFHPTVKPLALIRYLVTLVTPLGGSVLDPFLGSGTTALVARDLDLGFVGIEKEAEYLEIIKARLGAK